MVSVPPVLRGSAVRQAMAGSEPQPAPAVATVRAALVESAVREARVVSAVQAVLLASAARGVRAASEAPPVPVDAQPCASPTFPVGTTETTFRNASWTNPIRSFPATTSAARKSVERPAAQGADAEWRWKTVLSGQCAHIRPQPRHRVQPTSPRHASHRRKPAEVLRTIPVRRDNIVSISVFYVRRAAIVLTTFPPAATSTVGDWARAGRFQPAYSAVDRPKLYAAAME